MKFEIAGQKEKDLKATSGQGYLQEELKPTTYSLLELEGNPGAVPVHSSAAYWQNAMVHTRNAKLLQLSSTP